MQKFIDNKDYYRALAFQELLVSLVENPNVIDEKDYLLERNFFVKSYPNYSPEILKNCRTLKNFQNQLMTVAHGNGSWKLRREFIYNEFKSFLNYLEFGEKSKNETKMSGNIKK